MNPKGRYFRILVIACLAPLIGFSSTDSTQKRIRFFIHGAFVLNKSFSHYTSAWEGYGHIGGSSQLRSASNSYLPGFNLGVTALFGKRCSNFTVGLSFSQTSAHYSSLNTSLRAVYNVSTFQVTSLDIKTKVNILSLEGGYRIAIVRGFAIQPSMLLHMINKETQKQTGNENTVQSSNYIQGPGAPPDYHISTDVPINRTVKYKNDGSFSLRLTAFYGFKLRGARSTILAFRNIGLGYRLPWWGLGFGITV